MSSQRNKSGIKAFVAGEAIVACRLVKASTSTDSQGLAKVLMCDAEESELAIGWAPDAIASGATGTIELFGPTLKCQAGEAVEAGDPLYLGTDGVMVDTVNTSETPRLIALETVLSSGEYIEVARSL